MNPIRKLRDILSRDGIATRWVGGPLDGKIVRVPELRDELFICPEDNAGRSGPISQIRHTHKYVISQRVTLDGLPTYRHAGTVERAPA